MRSTGRRVAVLAIVVIAGCATEADDVEALVERVEAGSDTPRIDLDEGTADDAAYFLTEADIRSVTGLEDLDLLDTEDLPFYENPDPRTFCGDKTEPPPILRDFAARTFGSGDVAVVQLIGVYDAEARESMAAERASASDDCGPFESATNTGATQRVSDLHVVDLDGVGDDQFGGTATIEVGLSRVEIFTLSVAVGDRLSLVQAFLESAPSDDELRVLATLVAERLAG